MSKQRISYIKKTYVKSITWRPQQLWKITEGSGEEKTKILYVSDNLLEISDDNSFDEAMCFVKEELCDAQYGEGALEITRQEFDEYFTKLVTKINDISKI